MIYTSTYQSPIGSLLIAAKKNFYRKYRLFLENNVK